MQVGDLHGDLYQNCNREMMITFKFCINLESKAKGFPNRLNVGEDCDLWRAFLYAGAGYIDALPVQASS